MLNKLRYYNKRLQYFFFQRIIGINRGVPWDVHHSSIVSCPERIYFPKDTPFTLKPGYMPCCYIQAYNRIKLGKNIWMAKGCNLITTNHHIEDYHQYTEKGPIIIGDNCWLGVNTTILPGVILGEHTIVAAGSVVTKSFTQGNCIIAGIPATIIKEIPPYNGRL